MLGSCRVRGRVRSSSMFFQSAGSFRAFRIAMLPTTMVPALGGGVWDRALVLFSACKSSLKVVRILRESWKLLHVHAVSTVGEVEVLLLLLSTETKLAVLALLWCQLADVRITFLV